MFVAGKRKLDAAARLLATIGGKSQHTDAGDRSGGDSGRCRNQEVPRQTPSGFRGTSPERGLRFFGNLVAPLNGIVRVVARAFDDQV